MDVIGMCGWVDGCDRSGWMDAIGVCVCVCGWMDGCDKSGWIDSANYEL